MTMTLPSSTGNGVWYATATHTSEVSPTQAMTAGTWREPDPALKNAAKMLGWSGPASDAERDSALQVLLGAGQDAVYGILSEVKQYPRDEVFWDAWRVLRRLGEVAIEPLRRGMLQFGPVLQELALRVCIDSTDELRDRVGLLAQGLESRFPDVREAAATLAGEFGTREHTPLLARALEREGNDAVREVISDALAELEARQ